MRLLTIILAVSSAALAVGSSLTLSKPEDEEHYSPLADIVVTAYFTAITATLLYHLTRLQ